MPNFDRSGPKGEGSQTGKGLGKCGSGFSNQGLGGRLKRHNRGCHSKSSFEPVHMNDTEIIGLKRCKRKNH